MRQLHCAVTGSDMERKELMHIMPHRDPMLLVDRSELTDEGVTSEYTIPDNPYYTQGHFPGKPIVPEAILCEIMAQGSALLFEEKLKGKLALYTGMDRVRFKHSVFPGNKVIVRSKVSKCRNAYISVNAQAFVDDNICATGLLSFMLVDK